MTAKPKKTVFPYFLFVVGVIIIVVSHILKSPTPEKAVPTKEELKAAFPEAARLNESQRPFHHWLAVTATGDTAGVVFVTTDLPPDIRGYVGPVPVLVGMDKTGAVERLIVLRNNETPYYMRRVAESGLLDRLTGLKAAEDFDKVDAVSGATITSEAIVGDVKTAARLVALELFGIETPSEPRDIAPLLKAILLGAALMLALAARLRSGDRRLKWASWIAGIGITGVYLSIPLAFSHIVSVLGGNLPPLSNLSLVMLLLWTAITTIIWGPVFCGYACPFGALQEIAWRSAPVGRWRISESLGGRIRMFRWLVLFALVVAVFALGITEAAGFEPYPYLFERLHRLVFGGNGGVSATWTLTAFIWLYALFVLAVSTKFKRFWCVFFCPTGACLSLLSLGKRRRMSGGRADNDEETGRIM